MILPRTPLRHHFTVDVEEYFHVSALEPFVPRASWGARESRLTVGITQLLEILGEQGVHASWFVLGIVAERQPALVRLLAAEGHEVASHGWGHERVTQQSRRAFRESVRRSKRLLEDLTGESVLGFRAPSFSIVPGREWALDILLEEGHAYDSSLFPVRRPGYGYATGARDPHWIRRPAGRLLELPPTTLRRFGVNLPAAGGAYLRLLPYRLVHDGLAQSAGRGAQGTFYVHPWELDAEQPRVPVPFPTRIRHYGGLHRTAARIRALVAEFPFGPIRDTLAALEPAGEPGARSPALVPAP